MGKQPAVWVTGASSGIGKSIALLFAEQGVKVIATSRDHAALEKYLAEKNQNIFAYPADVTDLNEIKKTFEKISGSFFIKALINNAGVTSFKPVSELTDGETEKIISTNLTGAINLTRFVLPGMIEAGEGKIINILSVASEKIFKNSAVYSASKAGLAAFAKVLREEVREHSIRVVNIYPGAVRTPIWPSEILEQHADKMMSPDDVAKVVYDVYNEKSNLVQEEIVLRPVSGDLKI